MGRPRQGAYGEYYSCVRGVTDSYAEHSILADYIEIEEGHDPEEVIAQYCPYYENYVLSTKARPKRPGPPSEEGEVRSWPKKTVATVMIAIAILCAMVVGVGKDTTPTDIRPGVKREVLR